MSAGGGGTRWQDARRAAAPHAHLLHCIDVLRPGGETRITHRAPTYTENASAFVAVVTFVVIDIAVAARILDIMRAHLVCEQCTQVVARHGAPLKVEFGEREALSARLVAFAVQRHKVRVLQRLFDGQTLGWVELEQFLEQVAGCSGDRALVVTRTRQFQQFLAISNTSVQLHIQTKHERNKKVKSTAQAAPSTDASGKRRENGMRRAARSESTKVCGFWLPVRLGLVKTLTAAGAGVPSSETINCSKRTIEK